MERKTINTKSLESGENSKIVEKHIGVRHLQIFLLFSLISLAYAMRVNLSVGIVAMTDNTTTTNPNIPTYNWQDKSIVLSSFFWGYVISQVPAGQLGKYYGPKWFLVGAMTANSLACIFIPAMADWLGSAGVMGCRVLQGLSQGFIYPSVQNLLGKWAPSSERSRFGTFVYSGSSFGTVLGMAITGLISATWTGWPATFYLFGTLGAVWVVVWILLGSNSPAAHRTISAKEKLFIEKSLGVMRRVDVGSDVISTPWRAIATSAPVWAIIVAHCGQNWGYSTLLTEIPNYMNKIMKFDMKSNSLLSSVPYLALMVLSLIFGSTCDYLVNHNIMSRGIVRKLANSIGVGVPAIALISLSYVPDDQTTASICFLTIAVGINAGVFCGFQINHLDLSPNHAGTLMGITNGLSNVFSIIAPLVVQIVVYDEYDKSLWKIIFITAACIYVVSDIFYVAFASGEVQDWNDLADGSSSVTRKNQSVKKMEKQ